MRPSTVAAAVALLALSSCGLFEEKKKEEEAAASGDQTVRFAGEEGRLHRFRVDFIQGRTSSAQLVLYNDTPDTLSVDISGPERRSLTLVRGAEFDEALKPGDYDYQVDSDRAPATRGRIDMKKGLRYIWSIHYDRPVPP
ncbi:MAG: hypothetical protein HY720_23795 [Planctomycetes bacterium]|nr:hypothetical protein [Planctomycetota bacterium]